MSLFLLFFCTTVIDRAFLHEYEDARRVRLKTTDEDVERAEELEWKKMMEKNDAWNFEVGLVRYVYRGVAKNMNR